MNLTVSLMVKAGVWNNASGSEETRNPDADLDCRGGHCLRNHRIAFLGGIR